MASTSSQGATAAVDKKQNHVSKYGIITGTSQSGKKSFVNWYGELSNLNQTLSFRCEELSNYKLEGYQNPLHLVVFVVDVVWHADPPCEPCAPKDNDIRLFQRWMSSVDEKIPVLVIVNKLDECAKTGCTDESIIEKMKLWLGFSTDHMTQKSIDRIEMLTASLDEKYNKEKETRKHVKMWLKNKSSPTYLYA